MIQQSGHCALEWSGVKVSGGRVEHVDGVLKVEVVRHMLPVCVSCFRK